jgi:protein-tyrosine phosphatase
MFIEFDHIFNARDLGGIKTMDGRTVKSGMLLRTAKLSEPSREDVRRLSTEYNVKHVFDFRDGSERDKHPDAVIPGAENHFIPVLPELPGGDDASFMNLKADDVMELFRGMYRTMAENDVCAAAYSEFFRVLLGSGESVLWHCTQGKDRTGIAAILLLEAMGVSRGASKDDYFLTNIPMTRQYQAIVSEGKSEEELAFMRTVLFVMPECLNEFFYTTKKLYGGVDGYLRQRLGLRDADFSALRAMYTE